MAQPAPKAEQPKTEQPKPEQPKPGEKPKPEQFRGKGKVDSVAKGSVTMTTTEGQHWTLKFGHSVKLRIVGQAEAGYLASGEYVQFNALLDKKACRVKGPVKRATVFLAPSQEFSPGLFPDTSPEAQTAVAEAANLDVKSPWGAYVIAGQLVSAHGQKLVVTVPDLRERLRVELTEGAKIELASDDLSVVKAGDKIEAMGRKTGEDTATLYQARIRLAEPLSHPPKHRAAVKPLAKPTKPLAKPSKPADM